MMCEADIDRALGEIDAELLEAGPAAPVALGVELFAALVRRGLICDRLPAPIGEGPTEVLHPSTFRETHPARVDAHLGDRAFAVGARVKAG